MPIPHEPLTAARDAPDRSGLDPRRKRVLFRAWHRGMREMDLIMGRFADREIATLSGSDLDELERLMEEPDQLVYAWVTARAAAPPEFDTPLLARLGEHRV